MTALSPRRTFSGTALKTIACITMLVDHIGASCIEAGILTPGLDAGTLSQDALSAYPLYRLDMVLRFTGRLAFPLFCFLLSEGFRHTRNRPRYIGSMILFAFLSELPFDIGFFSAYSTMEGTFPFYLRYQNVFFTLSLGLLTLVCLERFSRSSRSGSGKIGLVFLQVLSIAFFALLAELIRCDYGMQGICFIAAFYICRGHRIGQVLLFLLAYMGTTGNQPPLCTLLACLLILLYNGQRGKFKLKYCFYAFYPIHISILYLITLQLEHFLPGN